MQSLVRNTWCAVQNHGAAWATRLNVALVTLGAWSVLAGSAWAATKKKAVEAPPEKSYVLPYFLVLLSMGLGIMILCRPGKRASEPFKKDAE